MALDTLYQVNTPEGINLRLSPAGPVVRMLAWSIDIAIRTGIYFLLAIPLAFFEYAGIGIFFILIFLLEWFYPVYFEVYKKGQTPGKKTFNLYVTMENASPISMGASVTRNLLRFADFMPFFYGFGLVSMMINKRFQRLGDLVANTVVLHQSVETTKITENDEIPAPPPINLHLKEQQALIRFQQRTPFLSTERAEELARLTGKLVDGDKAATSQLHAYAHWIMGSSK